MAVRDVFAGILRKKDPHGALRKTLRTLDGKLSDEEAVLLYELATRVREGVIVEVGSYRGKSTIALALGSIAGAGAAVYAIEPHESFTGPLGGEFGPQDRVVFFRQVLEAECAETVRLVNLSSEVLAPGWKTPVGLLWIDGDHGLEGTRRDAECWLPHLLPGSLVAFHDTLDETLGPHRVVGELCDGKDYELVRRLNTTAVLRKKA